MTRGKEGSSTTLGPAKIDENRGFIFSPETYDENTYEKVTSFYVKKELRRCYVIFRRDRLGGGGEISKCMHVQRDVEALKFQNLERHNYRRSFVRVLKGRSVFYRTVADITNRG